MSTQFVQREGVAILDMELRVTDNRTIPITGGTVLVNKADIRETCEGLSSAKFSVVSATRDYVDKLLREVMANQTPRLRWRIGIGFPQGEAEFIPWQEHIIRNVSSSIEGLGSSAGYVVVMETADLLWEINRFNRTLSRKGRISDIVTQIAEFYKLPAVIEQTTTAGQYYQSFISDYAFIKTRMLPRAINSKNRGNYQFYVRDGVLHFHTIDYQAELKNFAYYGSPGASLSIQDNSQELIDAGSAGARVVYYDPYTAEFGEVSSQPENTLRLSNTTSELNQLNAQRNVLMSLGTNRSVDATSIAANVFESTKTNVYTLSLVIPKTLFFRANDLCRVTIQPDNRQAPPSAGTYQVYKVKHTVDKTSLVSEVLFRRGEFLTKDKTHNVSNASETIIQPARGAPGQDPNLKAVAASVLTKGTGAQTGGTKIIETKDPNEA